MVLTRSFLNNHVNMTAKTLEQSPPSGVPSLSNADVNGQLRLAIQRSEGKRLLLFLLVVTLALTVSVIRRVTGGKAMQGETFVFALALFAVMFTYIAVKYAWVRKLNLRGLRMPIWVWAISTVIESLFPTAAIFVVLSGRRLPPIEAVTSPAIMYYGAVNALTILRIRPWLSVLCGVVCAAGFTGLLVYANQKLELRFEPGDLPFLAAYPAALLITGLAGAFVGFEVRKYFRASLREAQARRELDAAHKEIEIARSIQQGLMPVKSPDIPGFDIAGWNRPADRTGGDYYDWQVLPDGRLAVVIADVTGHGLGPALLMAVCRAYARAYMPIGPELQTVFSRVNTLLHADVSAGRFVTFAAAVIDPRSGETEILSAGHGPLLYLHKASGKVEELNGDGMPLGILDTEDYGSPRRIQLAPGDVLLLVTDGIIEWARASDDEQFGVDRLSEFLCQNSDLESKVLIDRIESEVRSFAEGTVQPDDMTIVSIRRIS